MALKQPSDVLHATISYQLTLSRLSRSLPSCVREARATRGIGYKAAARLYIEQSSSPHLAFVGSQVKILLFGIGATPVPANR